MLYTAGVKHDVLKRQEQGFYDEYFEKSESICVLAENIVKESGINDKVFVFV